MISFSVLTVDKARSSGKLTIQFNQPSWRLRLGYDDVFYVRSRVKSIMSVFLNETRDFEFGLLNISDGKMVFKGVS